LDILRYSSNIMVWNQSSNSKCV